MFSREWEGQEKDGNTEFMVQTFQKHVCGRHRTPGMASPLENLRSGPGGEAYTTYPHCRGALMKGWACGEGPAVHVGAKPMDDGGGEGHGVPAWAGPRLPRSLPSPQHMHREQGRGLQVGLRVWMYFSRLWDNTFLVWVF